MMRLLSVTALAGATFLVGCTSEREISSYDENGYQLNESELGYLGDYGNLGVRNAQTFGAMGPVRNIDGVASATGYSDADYTSVNVITTNANGSAMHMLSFTGNLAELPRGERHTFNINEYNYDSSAGVFAMSTNCSGTGEVGEWDYDAQAGETSVVVHDGPQEGEILVEYETISDDGFFGQDVSGGEFVLQQ